MQTISSWYCKMYNEYFNETNDISITKPGQLETNSARNNFVA